MTSTITHGKGKAARRMPMGKYKGEYDKDKKNGKGWMKFKDGTKFTVRGRTTLWLRESSFGRMVTSTKVSSGENTGRGKFIPADKEIAAIMRASGSTAISTATAASAGQWQCVQRRLRVQQEDGSGRLVYAKPFGDVYSGNWKDDKMHGKGRFNYANGSWYQGELQLGVIHGHGIFHYANGDEYEGEWCTTNTGWASLLLLMVTTKKDTLRKMNCRVWGVCV